MTRVPSEAAVTGSQLAQNTPTQLATQTDGASRGRPRPRTCAAAHWQHGVPVDHVRCTSQTQSIATYGRDGGLVCASAHRVLQHVLLVRQQAVVVEERVVLIAALRHRSPNHTRIAVR